jgi:ankyrin repeat protein
MLAMGVDPNLRNIEGETLLLSATGPDTDSRRLMKTLLEAGSDPNQVDKKGYSPVLQLINGTTWKPESALTSLKLLVKHGAELNCYHPNIGNSLWLAKQGGNDELIKYISEQGVISQAPKELKLAFFYTFQ